MTKKRLGPSEMLYPLPAVLVGTGTMGEPDITAVAWLCVASSTPATLAVAMRRTRHGLELARRTRSFTVNVASADLYAKVDRCGMVSGRSHDKLAETGLTLEPADKIVAPMVAECPLNFECVITREIELGEYVLLLGEVQETHCEESVLGPSGDKPDVALLDPLVYCAAVREYRRLGERLGDAFAAGKDLGPVP